VKRALVSDIHGNYDALRVVLADIRKQGIKEIYCLGDIIGYGPQPRECLDTALSFEMSLMGNHDQAALFDPDGFNPVALQAIYWTRDQLDGGPGGATKANKRWDFIGELPRLHVERDTMFVHGSPREPTNEYVFPEDVYNLRKMENLFGRFERLCFCGHTHIPGVFTESEGFDFLSPEEFEYEFKFDGRKNLINVGSVGQPRDGDPRACYAIQTEESVTFRRIEYDPNPTAQKIYNTPELDDMLGDRIKEGR